MRGAACPARACSSSGESVLGRGAGGALSFAGVLRGLALSRLPFMRFNFSIRAWSLALALKDRIRLRSASDASSRKWASSMPTILSSSGLSERRRSSIASASRRPTATWLVPTNTNSASLRNPRSKNSLSLRARRSTVSRSGVSETGDSSSPRLVSLPVLSTSLTSHGILRSTVTLWKVPALLRARIIFSLAFSVS